MAVPSGVGFWWPSTADSIPTGYDRNTDMDARYVKGTAVSTDPDVTGGATTHGHGTASHTHSRNHSHTASGNWGAPPYIYPVLYWAGTGYPIDRPSSQAHSITGAPTITGNVTSATPAWATSSNDPSYFEVIYIESDGVPAGVPDGTIGLFNNATAPTGWIQHVASKDTFLKGAAASGDGGGTGGGGAHTHAHSGSHSHTANHSHPTALSGVSAASGQESEYYAAWIAEHEHRHTQTFASTTVSTSSVSGNSTAGTTHEPAYHTLLGVENDSGGVSLPPGIIGGWLGLLAAIPSSWYLCDGSNSTPDLRGKFVKLANVTSEVGDTGGTGGHGHSAPSSHNHSITSHTHTISISTSHDSRGAYFAAVSGGSTHTAYAHQHTDSPSTAASAATTGSVAPSVVTESDTQPAFRTVAYIQFQVPQIELTGAQAAPSGALEIMPIVVLEGAQPAPSGALASNFLKKNVSGVEPAPSGTLFVSKLPVRGVQPAPSGTIAGHYIIALTSTQPAPSGRNFESKMPLRGAQPALSGTLQIRYIVGLAGAQPASTGTIDEQFTKKNLSGAQPTATGTPLPVKYIIGRVGVQAAPSGQNYESKMVTRGAQPAMSGILAQNFKTVYLGTLTAHAVQTGTLEDDG